MLNEWRKKASKQTTRLNIGREEKPWDGCPNEHQSCLSLCPFQRCALAESAHGYRVLDHHCGPRGWLSGKEPACRSMRVRSLGREAPLEEEMATHSSVLAWKIPWMEEPGGLQSMGLQSQTQLTMHTHAHTHCTIQFRINFCIDLQMFISYVNNS